MDSSDAAYTTLDDVMRHNTRDRGLRGGLRASLQVVVIIALGGRGFLYDKVGSNPCGVNAVVVPGPGVGRGDFGILSVHSRADDVSIKGMRQGREVNVVIGDKAKLQMRVDACDPVQDDV